MPAAAGGRSVPAEALAAIGARRGDRGGDRAGENMIAAMRSHKPDELATALDGLRSQQ